MEAFYFANDRLMGMYHQSSAAAQPRGHLVTICDAALHEAYKTPFVGRRAAACLADAGFDVLRFDYTGQGNSFGDLSAFCWAEDLDAAITEGLSLSGADRLSLVGFRIGALLASSYSGDVPVHSQVFWDPVTSGATWLSELQQVQTSLLDAHLYMQPGAYEVRDELCGFAVSPEFVEGIRSTSANSPSQGSVPTTIVRSEATLCETWQNAPEVNVIDAPYPCMWLHHGSRVLFAHGVVQAIEQELSA